MTGMSGRLCTEWRKGVVPPPVSFNSQVRELTDQLLWAVLEEGEVENVESREQDGRVDLEQEGGGRQDEAHKGHYVHGRVDRHVGREVPHHRRQLIDAGTHALF